MVYIVKLVIDFRLTGIIIGHANMALNSGGVALRSEVVLGPHSKSDSSPMHRCRAVTSQVSVRNHPCSDNDRTVLHEQAVWNVTNIHIE